MAERRAFYEKTWHYSHYERHFYNSPVISIRDDIRYYSAWYSRPVTFRVNGHSLILIKV